MFSFLSLPKPTLCPQARSLSPSQLFVLFLLFAFSLLLLLTALPVRAQGEEEGGGSWVAVPCDAQGVFLNPLSYYSSDDFFALTGTQHVTAANTYPREMVDAALAAYPSGYEAHWLNAASPPYTGAVPNSELGNEASSSLRYRAQACNYFGWPYGWSYSLSDGTTTRTGLVNGSVTVDVTGHLAAYYKMTWSPASAPNPTPLPDHKDFLLRTTLSAEASVSPGYPINLNGLWSTATATDGLPFGETASASAGLASDGSFVGSSGVSRVVGYHLVRAAVDPVTHILAVSVDGTTHSVANNDVLYGILSDDSEEGGPVTNGPASASAVGTVSAGVKPDDREAEIGSLSIETSYFKSNDGYSGSPVQAQHYRNPDGSIAVDSAVAWINVPGDPSYPRGWQVNSLPLTANTVDFQEPSYAWSLSGLTIDQAGLELPLRSLSRTANFHLIEPDTNKFPLDCTVRVDVTDSDGAVAANTYGITWHLPYEKTAFLGSVPEKVKLEKLYGPIEEGGFSDVTASEGRDIDISEGCELAGGAAAATGQEDIAAILEIVGKLAKLTDTKYHYAGENIQKGTQNGQDKWDATLVNPEWAANVNNPDLLTHFNAKEQKFDGWAFCKLEIYEVKHYHHMTWAADKYNSHGYEGTGYTLHADPVDKIDEEPYYTQDLFLNPQ